MIRKIFIILILSYFSILTASESEEWRMVQTSQKDHYQIHLRCDHPPTFNGFQQCDFKLLDKSNKFVVTSVIIDGGMPEHHHGLPTKPVSVLDESKNHINIKGLKFSMPGAWQLKFLIEKTDTLPRDIATIEFNID